MVLVRCLHCYWLKAKTFIAASSAAGLTANTVTRMDNLHIPSCGIIFINLFICKYIPDTHFVAATAADTKLTVNTLDELWRPLRHISSQPGNIRHLAIPPFVSVVVYYR